MEHHPGSFGRGTAAPLFCQPRLPRNRARVDLRLPLQLGKAAARRLLPPPQPAAPAPAPAAAAAEQEAAPHGWGCSGLVVALDVVLNSAFLVVSAVVLLSTGRERPAMPIRAWAFGYALQCLIHVAFVSVEHGRRGRTRERGRRSAVGEVEEECRAVKKLKSINAMISLLWWILGFYWIVAGGQALLQDAPRLYWLTVVFLSFDVFFAFFCVALAAAVGLALCCCLPFAIAVLHALAGEEVASNTNLESLPKYRFCQANQPDTVGLGRGQVSITDVSLPPEDSTAKLKALRELLATLLLQSASFVYGDYPNERYDCCCICLCQYEDGVELLSLPCNHHFHSDCVLKWLRIDTRCPLCKHNILEEEVPV